MAQTEFAEVGFRERTDVVPCAGAEGDLWFASNPTAIERAKSLCRECPLRDSCLANAIDRQEPWGVWGGQLFENGVVIAQKRRPGRPRKDATQLAS
ncbi:WhiB family transcriptional regulator, redox-sensing transcriptional regulator [Nocardioides terrae]|uniref:Transcriptional regulator WhiB n=1 Tax=Nocardioides terrae TaxID=574651 RepID=A0A1I1P6F2_9ACTN|nr:WhiB family transcriptional regulator [Nocardioides terrae]SFD02573.1 WhiB family transcriptional regulator, redox-sensing transcriptional regulator [Nocardioides terrae]